MLLHQSNRLEILGAHLLEVIARPPADPLRPECIVVPNQGMAQWLGRRIALATGIAANLDFPLPGRFIWDLLHRLADSPPEEDLFARPVLRWRIAGLLPARLDQPPFAELAAYLADDGDGRKLLQLAERISDVFDQYLVFRPDLLARWQRPGHDEHWQALLWRQLCASGTPLRALVGDRCRQLLERPAARARGTAAPTSTRAPTTSSTSPATTYSTSSDGRVGASCPGMPSSNSWTTAAVSRRDVR